MSKSTLMLVFAMSAALAGLPTAANAASDAETVAALDTEYQAAVERNDWQTMDRIFHPDFTLVIGSGKSFTRAELIASAREAQNIYEKQVEMPGTQTVRIFGADTATVTALLWLKESAPRIRAPSTTSCGLPTRTCARRMAGATRSDRRRCVCPTSAAGGSRVPRGDRSATAR